jgi:hypothetical protein
MDGIRVDFLSD